MKIRDFTIIYIVFTVVLFGQTNPYKAPLYWSVYENHIIQAYNHIPDNYITEEDFAANIDWVSENLKPYGYKMICVDGWGDMTILNENGYRKSHSRHWQHDFAWWSNYIQERGMTLGMYGNPLWINVNASNNTTKIAGTDILVSSLINTSENAKFTWVQVNRPGAEQYIKGCIKYYSQMGVKYFRVDFLSWYENGWDRYLGTVGPNRPHEDYVKALRWMREAADSCGMFLSLVMPHLNNEAEVEKLYGNMIRIDEDTETGGWSRWSDNARGIKRTGWSVYANPMDGLTYWSYISGAGKVILDPDFIRLNTFANNDEKKSVISACLIAGSPVTTADQVSTIESDIWLYINKELLELNENGISGKPISNNPTNVNSQIWKAELGNGEWVVGLFNRENYEVTRTIDFAGLGISGTGKVRDLWKHKNIGSMSYYSVVLPPHGCSVIKVVPESHQLNGPDAMYVDTLDATTEPMCGGYTGKAKVIIKSNGIPIQGAKVTVRFLGSFNEFVSGVTNYSGEVILNTQAIITGGVKVIAYIVNVKHDSFIYAGDLNKVTSAGKNMYAAGTYNDWKLSPMKYEEGYWKKDSVIIGKGNHEMKFANSKNWSGDDWGDATGMTGTAKLSTGGKPNIKFSIPRRRLFNIKFNEESLEYAITESSIKTLQSNMYVRGTFNNWQAQPMYFTGNVWKTEGLQIPAGNHVYKIANTDDWSGDDWGNAVGMSGELQLTTGGSPNASFTVTQSGNYDFYFNDISLLYSIGSDLVTDTEGKNVVNEFRLEQNYPNPFNPETIIEYSIAEAGNVTIKVYDVLGNELRILVNEYKTAGKHGVVFNGSSLASGIYFYKIINGNKTIVKKMLMVK